MILDCLSNLERYAATHPRIAAIAAFLKRTPLADLPTGRTEIDGDRLFVLTNDEQGKGQANARLEAHRKYFDIQIAVGGADLIGWKPLSACKQIAVEYSPERDIQFFDDAPDVWLPLAEGSFMLFYPEDAHAPLAVDGPVRKVVFKAQLE